MSRGDDNAGTAPVDERHQFDPSALTRFLANRLPGFSGPIVIEQFRGGQSNPTYLVKAATGDFVLRRKPPGHTLKTAHAVDREFRVISALRPHGVPVAKPLLLCEDAEVIGTPFYLMEYVAGRIFWDPTLPDLSPSDRRAVYHEMSDVLIAVHAVDIVAANLTDLGKPGDYYQRQIRRWANPYLEGGGVDLPGMKYLIDWLGDHPPVPTDRVTVIHGDYRLDNLIFDRDELRIRAVIDWELTTLGDPLADLSYQCTLWRLPTSMFAGLAGADRTALGIPTEEAYRDRYLERAGLGPVVNWDRYIVYNLFRFAAILDGIGHRIQRGTAASPRAVEFATLAGPVAEQAVALAGRIG